MASRISNALALALSTTLLVGLGLSDAAANKIDADSRTPKIGAFDFGNPTGSDPAILQCELNLPAAYDFDDEVGVISLSPYQVGPVKSDGQVYNLKASLNSGRLLVFDPPDRGMLVFDMPGHPVVRLPYMFLDVLDGGGWFCASLELRQ